MQNKIYCILGRKGQGKTTLAKKLLAYSTRIIVIDTIAEYTELPAASIQHIDKLFTLDRFAARLIPDSKQSFIAMLAALARHNNFMLVIDETGCWQSVNDIPAILFNIVRFGRHQQINQCYIARRPTELNRMLTAMTDIFYILQTTEPRDLQYFQQIVTRTAIDKIKHLQQYQYLKYDTSKPKLLQTAYLTAGII